MMDTRNIRMFSFYIPGDSKEARVQYKDQVFDRIGKFVDYA